MSRGRTRGATSPAAGAGEAAALAEDGRVVLTVDAGGTSFRFNAIRGGRLLHAPLRMRTRGDHLDACLDQLLAGFEAVRARNGAIAAISFGFPGPADYAGGVLGDLPNFPAFRGGVALGPLLAERFGVPVFMNNDGALFAYGEALGGLLPWVNGRLAAAASALRYGNLVGFTFGTGFGGGVVIDGRLLRGDNSSAAQVWTLRHRDQRSRFAEEGVTIRAVRRVYAAAAEIDLEEAPEPRDIAHIAAGELPGDGPAAREAFRRLGEVAGDAIAQVLSVVDGLVVLGGGIAAAARFYMPALLEELNGHLLWADGRASPRLCMRAYDLTDESGLDRLVRGSPREVEVRGAGRTVTYDPEKRTGVGLSRLGTSEAIALGAYAFALRALDAEYG